MRKQIKVSFFFTLISTVTLGIIYPVLLSGIALVIPSSTRPTLLQTKPSDDLFQGRPSMSGGPYSGASNLSLTNQELAKQVEIRLKRISEDSPGVLIPRELLFASGSGYDPEISVEGARIQLSRIAKARNQTEGDLRQLVDQHTRRKLLGFIGTDKVNVVDLNKDLETLSSKINPPAAP
jgi:K+-transporting ATPase ATPase C chain